LAVTGTELRGVVGKPPSAKKQRQRRTMGADEKQLIMFEP
jgi:hypothetical protein